jgi:hypothetical protein
MIPDLSFSVKTSEGNDWKITARNPNDFDPKNKYGKIFRDQLIPLSEEAKKRINSRFTFWYVNENPSSEDKKVKVLIKAENYFVFNGRRSIEYELGHYGIEAWLNEKNQIIPNYRPSHGGEKFVVDKDYPSISLWPTISKIGEAEQLFCKEKDDNTKPF